MMSREKFATLEEWLSVRRDGWGLPCAIVPPREDERCDECHRRRSSCPEWDGPQRLKPSLSLRHVSARLKTCPDTSLVGKDSEVSLQAQDFPGLLVVSGHAFRRAAAVGVVITL